jgi:glycosyl transferase family WbsX
MPIRTGILILLAGTIVCAAQEPKKERLSPLLVGAHYYPWYYPQKWTLEPVCDTPQLGHYDSGNRAVARRHVQWAKQAGLDFFMVSWINPTGREDQNFRQTVLPEIEEQGFRFAFHYETALALDLIAGKPLDFDQKREDGTRAGDRFIAHFDYLADTYLKRRSYLTFNGEVVVQVYLVREMVHSGPYLKQVRERLRKRGIELYLIADVVYWAPPETFDWALLKEHFQAITAYNMYHRPQFLERVQSQFEASDRMARENGLAFIPNVMPGYDDTRLRGRDRATLDRQGGAFYRSFWKTASSFVSADQPFLLITSFNEWHEGTELEPSREFGDSYITLTSQMIAKKRAEIALPPAK